MAKSIKGKEVNMEALMIQNQHAVALGNARMNARGDLLGRNGKVVKTREDLANEYNTQAPNAAVTAPISSDVMNKVKAADKKPSKPETKE
jgi:hypothetical protein